MSTASLAPEGKNISKRTPEQRAKDLRDIMSWMRNLEDGSLDPTGDFRKIDSILPKKRGQSKRERALEIENALDWVRNTSAFPGYDSENVSDFTKLGSIPVSRRSPEE